MLHPSYTDLIEAVNSGVEPGEQPVVQSRYSIIIAAAKRGRQIVDGSEPMVARAAGKKALSVAVQELYEQKISILPEGSDEEEEMAVEEVTEEVAVEETEEIAEEAEETVEA